MKWEIVPLKDLTTFIDYRGKTPFKTNSGIPLITAKNIKNRFLDLSTLEYIDTKNYDKWMTRGIPEPNDILFTTEGPVGNVAKLKIDEKIALAQRIVAIRCKKGLYPDYLLYCLTSDIVKKEINKRITGSTVKGIRSKELQKVKIPLPPLEIQNRIAAVLNQADQLPRMRKKTIALLDELLSSIFLDMFGDPVKNPKKWGIVLFNEVIESIENGVSPVCESYQRSDERQLAVLKLSGVTSCVFKPDENKLLPSDISLTKNVEIKKGDLLFSRKNTKDLVGACAYVFNTPSKLLLPDIIFRLNYNHQKAFGQYLWLLFIHKNFRKKIQRLATGSAGSMPNISKEKLKKLKIPLPPFEYQRKFALIVEQIETIRVKMQKSLEEMEILFHSLMQKAFKRGLNIKEDTLDSLVEGKIPTEDLHKTPVVEEICAASPEEFITLHHTVQCDIKDCSKKIEVEHKILMQLVNIDKYKAKQKGKSLKEWIKEKLNEITQIAMFDKRYVDILLDFEKPEEKRQIMKSIKDGMKRFAESIGYTTKHIIVEPNLKPLLLKREGFIIQKSGDFSTLNHRVNVKLDIIVTGKLCDLSKISQYITPEKDIIVEMEQVIYQEAEKQMHKVDPQKFYMPFKYPDEEPIEEILKTGIEKLLQEVFFAEDVTVIIKRMATDILQRILNLINGNPYQIDVEVLPFRGGRTQETIIFAVEFLVKTVSDWNTFIYKNFESHEQEIARIKQALIDDIAGKFQTIPFEVLKYTSYDHSRKLLEVARKSQGKISGIFGLDINLTDVKRKSTMIEAAQQAILRKKVEVQKEQEIDIIEKEKEGNLKKVDELQKLSLKYLDAEFSDEDLMDFAEKDIEKIKNKAKEISIESADFFKLPAPDSSGDWKPEDYADEFSNVPGDNAATSYEGLSTKDKPKFTDFLKYIKYIFRRQPFRFSDLMNAVKDETTDYENVKNLVYDALREGLNEKGMHLKQCFFDESFDSGDEELNKKLRGAIGFQIENKK